MKGLGCLRSALCLTPSLLLAQTWTYTPPAYPAVCTNLAVVGQWTMDYATATNRALAEGRNLYLLITGSTWCPDCDTLQRQVMEKPDLQSFMDESDAYWVWLDLPSRRATNAVQYGWLCHTNTGFFTLEESASILARNREIEFIYGSVKNYRSPGTLNMPTFVVCHPDGTYQGEVTHYRQWTHVTPEVFIRKIRRVWNDDAWDVQDNCVPGKSDDEAFCATVLTDFSENATRQPHTFSPTDEADWYTFTAQPGRSYTFTVEARLLNGQAAVPAGPVALEIFAETNAAAVPVASASGLLGETQTVAWELNQALPLKLYVKVSGAFAEAAGYEFAYRQFIAAAPTAMPIRGAEGAVIDVYDSSRVTGALNLSVSRSGWLTAKYRTKNRTVAFSAKRFWSSFDANGILTSAVSAGEYRLSVQMPGAGELYAVVADPDYANPLAASLLVSPWSASNRATAYAGYYTVVLAPETTAGGLAPTGYSYMTILLKNASAKKGKVTYAGRLSDGTGYSGSATLQPLADGTAQMTVFARKGKHHLAGLLAIDAYAEATRRDNPSAVSACAGVTPHWTRDTGHAETSFDMTLAVFGGYYGSADSLLDFYGLYAGDGPMCLLASGNMPESAVYGTAAEVPFLPLAVSESLLKIPAGTDNPTQTRLSFSKTTGIFRGFIKIPFESPAVRINKVTAMYAGVLLPGWTADEGCDLGCGDPVPGFPQKPFGMGSYWYRDKLPVGTGPAVRNVSFTAGYPIIIDKVTE